MLPVPSGSYYYIQALSSQQSINYPIGESTVPKSSSILIWGENNGNLLGLNYAVILNITDDDKSNEVCYNCSSIYNAQII